MLRATTTSTRQAAKPAATPTPPTPLARAPAATPAAAAALAALALATAPPPAADASPLADFWRSRQSANGGIKLLAPLRTSQMRLEEASRLFATALPSAAPALVAEASTTSAPGAIEALAATADPTSDDLVRALALVRASSLNCYAYDSAAADSLEAKASLFQQSLGGADPCTWRIIVRNVTTLEPPEKRQEGMAMTEELVRSYQLLDALLGESADGRPGALDRARAQAEQTLRIERDIEGFVRGVLKV
jgi:hypothetical protein